MISNLHVMESNAGFYLGRDEDGMPYSRQSGYYRNQNDAEAALTIYPLTRRECIENKGIYILENQMENPRDVLPRTPQFFVE